ncbi:hypothetical protein EJ02DRAFT_474625 [Clathrospora elynae]|uniref:Ricin B lectin domain-containing protein n=1 Tax=Clathrospora elynae TaxID=706981 RepID=A0A6A5SDW9_9PLEO|nr:hypothetical protein EJ02DRAFT_474625 [Clathrospora elynae]
MAQVSKIDPNQWYSLYIGTGTQNLVGTTLFQADRSVGTVYIAGEDTSKRNQRWQIFKLNSTAWILRSQAGGPNAYLGTFYAEPEVTEGKTVPRIVRGDIADASVFWTIGSWGDTTWYFSNLANGTGYRLMLKPTGGYLAMSPNITAPQVGQKWQFDTITAINDQRYSSVNVSRLSWIGEVETILKLRFFSWSTQ